MQQAENLRRNIHAFLICRFKVWNIYGAQLYSSPPSSEELYEVSWRTSPDGFYPVPEIKTVKAVPSVQQQQQQGMFCAPAVMIFWCSLSTGDVCYGIPLFSLVRDGV
jgi:hypothetical protein